MSLTFRNRIALYYMIATAIIIAVVFSIVFFVVQNTVYNNLDTDLSIEAIKHTNEITIENDIIRFNNKKEWEEKEHREVQVNPVFIQIIDSKGELMDKSPNLKEDYLLFHDDLKHGTHFSTLLNGRTIRQVQIPLELRGTTKGFIIAAMSLEPSLMVINDLKNILLITFPIILFGLFFISRFLAGRSIMPVQKISETTNTITKHNLSDRVTLPPNKDELYDLSHSINNLLDRIESAVVRERQFTSDASHELRTPLATLKGTLEVLIRKPRAETEYIEKVKYSLTEIDRMSNILEQLLILARFDKYQELESNDSIDLVTLIDDIISRHQSKLSANNIQLKFSSALDHSFPVPHYYTNLILENIISNAIKYSPPNELLQIKLQQSQERIICIVTDKGIGIDESHLKNIFNPFFRSNSLKHKHIKGIGLGLSIAYKAAQAIGASISVESKLHQGSSFHISF
jgi:signal transduction histidine kinase